MALTLLSRFAGPKALLVPCFLLTREQPAVGKTQRRSIVPMWQSTPFILCSHNYSSSSAGALGFNFSHASDLLQNAQDLVSVFVPADKAEVNTLSKAVSSLQVALSPCASPAPCIGCAPSIPC